MKWFLRVVFCLFAVLVAGASASADLIPLNGDFSDGLSHWLVEFGDVTDGGGYAFFQEDPDSLSSTLSQEFTIPSAALRLSFDLQMLGVPGGDSDPSAWPDAFTASLLDASTLDPLISWDPFVTEFFLLENTGAMETSAGMTVIGDTVTLDVSSWAGQDVLLSFDLWASDDGMTTTVNLDDVRVSVVPLPAGALLGVLGLVSGLMGLHFRPGRAA